MHQKEALEMTKGLDCMPDHDKNLFNTIFVKIHDIDELVLLQAKALDFFGQYLKIDGKSYCAVFLDMTKHVEDTLSYDIHKMKYYASNKTQAQLNHDKMVQKGWYDALNYIRLLPNDIKTKCEEFVPIKASLNDGSQESIYLSHGRDEKAILKCINTHRDVVLKLSIAHRLN